MYNSENENLYAYEYFYQHNQFEQSKLNLSLFEVYISRTYTPFYDKFPTTQSILKLSFIKINKFY